MFYRTNRMRMRQGVIRIQDRNIKRLGIGYVLFNVAAIVLLLGITL